MSSINRLYKPKLKGTKAQIFNTAGKIVAKSYKHSKHLNVMLLPANQTATTMHDILFLRHLVPALNLYIVEGHSRTEYDNVCYQFDETLNHLRAVGFDWEFGDSWFGNILQDQLLEVPKINILLADVCGAFLPRHNYTFSKTLSDMKYPKWVLLNVGTGREPSYISSPDLKGYKKIKEFTYSDPCRFWTTLYKRMNTRGFSLDELEV